MADGSPEPLGVHLAGDGANVAIPAPCADALFLCVFDGTGSREVARHRLTGRTGDVFHGHLPGVTPGTRYGLRADGPWAPERGLRFNPAKLLLDPWARELDRPFALHASLFDTGPQPDATDSAPHMPKGIVTMPMPGAVAHGACARPHLMPAARTTDAMPAALSGSGADPDGAERAPRMTETALQEMGPTGVGAQTGATPPAARVIYELHVRGFTKRHPDIPEAIRGTFAALGHPAAVAHLVRLGVTHVELLPCAAWVDERHLPALGLSNHWGYNPVGFLAPDPRLAPGGMAEIRAAVAALHAAGIGVILDIVLNHSGESDEHGPTLSLRGLGDTAWYRAHPDDPGRYANDAGCGNTLALDRPWPLRLAMDAMRHWVEAAGLDGLRLDLATTLGRRDAGFDPHAPLLLAMRQDPVLRDRLIIAEPWDIGPGGYQLGAFPAGWAEWNDRFRDGVRRFWRGDAGALGELATRLAGSGDVFGARPSHDSLNYVTAHDGFTLADLVSHADRHNEANGEHNRDGTSDNLSWNNGAEGATDDPAILARRRADARALLATLLSARGTPMLAMGDEAGRSQRGNNNAYCQDNALSWFDWAGADDERIAFAARLVAARRAHPALHAAAPLTGAQDGAGEPDVRWLRPDGAAMQDHEWPHARSLAMLLRAADDRALVAINGSADAHPLALPQPRWGLAWRLVADSADPGREGAAAHPTLAPRSVALFVEAPPAPRRAAAPDPALLARLARAAGIETAWHDIAGTRTEVPEATLRALLAALGLPAETAAQARDSLAHRLATTRVSPPATERCHLPAPGRRFAVMAQSFALRHAHDQGIGDYTAMAQFGAAAAAQGATLLGISPPHALPLTDRERASPYQASDRRFLEPVLLDVAALPVVGDAPAVRAALADEAPLFAALRRRDLVDYPAAWAAKRRVLAAAWSAMPRGHAGLAAFRAAQGPALDHFATFCALTEARGPDPRGWAGCAHPTDAAIAAFQAAHADRIGFHAFLQWLCDEQLAAAASAGPGLYRDLAVGAAPDGAETWSQRGAFLRGFSIGAPPDPFAPQGQVWGLPVPHPHHAEATGHAGFAALLAANMRHARALRIDHVMGIERLFVVPEGAAGAAGCYLRFDREGMLAAIARESRRAACTVIGEALGTVPEGLPGRLSDAGILAYRVLWFERDGAAFRAPRHWPEAAAACVSTHDLPPVLGWWDGTDIAEREAIGLLDAAAASAERRARAADRAALLHALDLPADAAPEAFATAVHAFVAATPAVLMLVQAEDLAGARIGVNLPGSDRERPNWRRRLPGGAADPCGGALAHAILAALRDRAA